MPMTAHESMASVDPHRPKPGHKAEYQCPICQSDMYYNLRPLFEYTPDEPMLVSCESKDMDFTCPFYENVYEPYIVKLIERLDGR